MNGENEKCLCEEVIRFEKNISNLSNIIYNNI